MSVVGIDLGNINSVIGVARNRGIDIICNDISNRATPALVSFGTHQRFLGESARSQEISNLPNTFGGFKRLLGRKIGDPEVKLEQKYLTSQLVDVDGQLGAEVNFMGQRRKFTVVQLYAMYLNGLKEIVEKEIKMPMNDCVLSIPCYYTDVQRRALIDSAEIAGLNVLRLVSDTTAAALQWGITKSDLPEGAPKYVAFVDLGQSDFSVSIVAYQKGKMAVKGVASDSHIGGRDFDDALFNYFVEEFKTKYKMDVRTNLKASYRLRVTCERVKKILSANHQAPLNIECLMNEKDVASMIERSKFEELISGLLDRLVQPMERAMAMAGVSKDDISCVEIVGGCTRIPIIKHYISNFFGKEISNTLNQEECVAKGCAFMCAIISPTFQVREFKVDDVSNYPIKISWKDEDRNSEILAFSTNSIVPSTKLLTFYRKEEFTVDAHYADVERNDWIGTYQVKNVVPSPTGDASTIKLKVRLNPSGIFDIIGAQSVLETEEIEMVPVKEEKPKDDQTPNKENQSEGTSPKDANEGSNEEDKPAPMEEVKKKKLEKKELPVAGKTTSLSNTEKMSFKEIENEFCANDKLIRDTEERRNALEEYVYDMRAKLDCEYSEFVSEVEKDTLVRLLADTEDWLYGEGEEATKSAYIGKLEELAKLGNPIYEKYKAATTPSPLPEEELKTEENQEKQENQNVPKNDIDMNDEMVVET
jgi:heat shock protein 4